MNGSGSAKGWMRGRRKGRALAQHKTLPALRYMQDPENSSGEASLRQLKTAVRSVNRSNKMIAGQMEPLGTLYVA